MRRTRFWVLLLGGTALLAVLGTFWLSRSAGGGTVANVYQDGVLVWSIDLSEVREAEELTIEGPAGGNTVQAEPGRIRVSGAGCPDQICVGQGWLSGGVTPIVCLPNRLVIRLEEGENELDLDGVSG
ncbi:MAG: NusG domain II-containing protein [Oscillospiraceae bacterium]|nr:NusG domain II-containing protein [Oscillospiraceae bacterium]